MDDAALADESRQLVLRLAQLPAHAIHEVRELYLASETNTLPEQLALERQSELADGPAFAEGVGAFLGKRKPRFAPR